jgi:hypothetical protein
MKRSFERGFTAIEILLIIAAILILFVIGWTVIGGSEAETCRSQLIGVQRAVSSWNATTSQTDPVGDRILCTTARDEVTRYNRRCGEVAGAVPVPACE